MEGRRLARKVGKRATGDGMGSSRRADAGRRNDARSPVGGTASGGPTATWAPSRRRTRRRSLARVYGKKAGMVGGDTSSLAPTYPPSLARVDPEDGNEIWGRFSSAALPYRLSRL